jgi:hypothetical protein
MIASTDALPLVTWSKSELLLDSSLSESDEKSSILLVDAGAAAGPGLEDLSLICILF